MDFDKFLLGKADKLFKSGKTEQATRLESYALNHIAKQIENLKKA